MLVMALHCCLPTDRVHEQGTEFDLKKPSRLGFFLIRQEVFTYRIKPVLEMDRSVTMKYSFK